VLSLSLPSTSFSLSLLLLPPTVRRMHRLYKIVKMRDGKQEEGKPNESSPARFVNNYTKDIT
jgi:hypothetical protein